MKLKRIIIIVSVIVVCAIIGIVIFLTGNTEDPSDPSVPGGSSGNGTENSHTHTWVLESITDSTCTEVGRKDYVCEATDCFETYSEEIPLKDHTEVIDELVEATCFETGLSEGSHCSICETIIVEQTELPILEHEFVNNICIHCGNDYYTPNSYFELTDDGDSYKYVSPVITDSIVIPDEYNGIPVTSFELDNELWETVTEIVIGDNITFIPKYAFQNYTSLESLTIGTKVQSIEEGAFTNCDSLVEVIIPDNVKTLGKDAFTWCENLERIVIGNGVTVVPTDFASSSNYLDIVLGENVKIVEDAAFGIKSISIPNGIEYFGSQYLSDNIELTKNGEGYYLGNHSNPYLVLVKTDEIIGNTIDIHSNCKIIYKSALASQNNLESILFSDKITHIGETALSNCQNLQNLQIGSNTKYIGREFINGTFSLKRLSIPSNVIEIQENFFPYIEMITVDTYNRVYDSRNGCNAIIEKETDTLIAGTSITVIPDSVKHIASFAFYTCSFTNITIPGNVLTIGEYAFSACKNLTKITIPNSVTEIEASAFYECTDLKEVKIGSSLKEIKGGVFSDCTSLNNLEIGENVEKITSSAFLNCTSLRELFIPKNVKIIEPSAFERCSNLETMTVDKENIVYHSIEEYNGVIETNTNKLILVGKNAPIMDGIVTLYTGLYYFSNISEILIPDSVLYIENHVFYGCQALSSVKLSKNLKSIELNAFSDCVSLTEVYLPKSLEYIGANAFTGSGLEKIYFEGTIQEWDLISKEGAFDGLEVEIIYNSSMN